MKSGIFHRNMWFWLQISVKAVCTKTVEWIGRQELETWKHRQSAEENPQDRYNCLVTGQRKTAFVA